MDYKKQTRRNARYEKVDKNAKASSQTISKKLIQKSSNKKLEASRVKSSTRSVNYLSSTTASRAKAASTAQIHKPTTSASVNKLITSAVIKSDLSLKQRRPKSANNNKENVVDASGAVAEKGPSISSRRPGFKGKSRSQTVLKTNNAGLGGRKPQAKLQQRDRSLAGQANKDNMDILDKDQTIKHEKNILKAALDVGSPPTTSTQPNRLSHSSTRSSGERKGILHVTMNKTSELRAALHRPLIAKRSVTARSDTSKTGSSKKAFRPSLTRESKLKKRARKRLSTSSPKAPTDSTSLSSTAAKATRSKEST